MTKRALQSTYPAPPLLEETCQPTFVHVKNARHTRCEVSDNLSIFIDEVKFFIVIFNPSQTFIESADGSINWPGNPVAMRVDKSPLAILAYKLELGLR